VVRIVNDSLTPHPRQLAADERRRAERRLSRRQAANPLRRVLLACETTYVRDPVAVVGDHLWCEAHADFARVVDLVE
jgi:hypothetical protein